ncbi:MAG: hypothetical protein CMJ83_22640 [Planctomycetes bacterium]|nr:hypothetical protein [Planctomycetota bacterium]
MTSAENGDRRKAPRMETDLQGVLGSEKVTCQVINLSKTGALAISSHHLEEMNMVRIGVSIEDGGETADFACEAAVVRCDPRPDGRYDLGLYFTSMDDDARDVLQRMLKHGSLVPVS